MGSAKGTRSPMPRCQARRCLEILESLNSLPLNSDSFGDRCFKIPFNCNSEPENSGPDRAHRASALGVDPPSKCGSAGRSVGSHAPPFFGHSIAG